MKFQYTCLSRREKKVIPKTNLSKFRDKFVFFILLGNLENSEGQARDLALLMSFFVNEKHQSVTLHWLHSDIYRRSGNSDNL